MDNNSNNQIIDKSADDILENIVQDLNANKKVAPAVIGKPVFANDLELAKMTGAKTLAQLFGQKVNEKSDAAALPVNFGSKAETGFLPADVRLRLFNLKKAISDVEIQSQVKYPNQHISPEMMQNTELYKSHLAPLLKAYNITDFSNWIPTLNTRFYFDEYEIPFLLANQFDTLPMESPTIEVPGDLGHLEGFEETDNAVFTAQNTTQGQYSVTARNNVVHAQITEDLLSDSAPKYIERFRRNVLTGIARAYEKALINGDITGTPRGASHMDTDIRALPLNNTFQKAFSGIRKLAMANDAALGAGTIVYGHGDDTASKTLFATVMNLMGKFASEKDDLFWLIPSSIENQLVTGAIPELFTAFAFGGLASNVTGQCPPIFGIRTVTSQFVREDLDDNGVYDAAGTRTHIALIKKSRFANFVRQAVRVWAAPSLPSSDIMLMTAKMRHSFAGNPQSANEKSIVMGINIARA